MRRSSSATHAAIVCTFCKYLLLFSKTTEFTIVKSYTFICIINVCVCACARKLLCLYCIVNFCYIYVIRVFAGKNFLCGEYIVSSSCVWLCACARPLHNVRVNNKSNHSLLLFYNTHKLLAHPNTLACAFCRHWEIPGDRSVTFSEKRKKEKRTALVLYHTEDVHRSPYSNNNNNIFIHLNILNHPRRLLRGFSVWKRFRQNCV